MEDHDVSTGRRTTRPRPLTMNRYSEILDYHNVDAAAQEQGDNDS
jgi:hypothetical protein